MHDNMSVKLVYRPNKSGFYARDVTHLLDVEFPFISDGFLLFNAYKIRFIDKLGRDCLAWRDKHKNIIIRIYRADTQISLDL